MKTLLRLAVACFLLLLACPTIQAQPDTLRLRVMTYNLRFGELASLDELAAHIKAFKPDFVALQEVDVRTNRSMTPHQNGKDFISELAYKSHMLGLLGKAIDFAGGYYGIGILSKYPYTKVEKLLLPNPDNEEQRALLYAAFEVGKDTVVFATTHLDVVSEKTRTLQAEFISRHFAGSQQPVIIGGDFNAEDDSPTTAFMNRYWTPLSDKALTFPSSGPKKRIDYLFSLPQKGWRVVQSQVVRSLLSDHCPIVTDIEYIR